MTIAPLERGRRGFGGAMIPAKRMHSTASADRLACVRASRTIRLLFSLIVMAVLFSAYAWNAFAQDIPVSPEARGGDEEQLGARLPLWSVIPFLGILLSIALGPLLAPHFWHRHFPKASLFWALCFAVPFVAAMRGEAIHEILHILLVDYLPFVLLLWALFTVSGGILLRGTLPGTPAGNTMTLGIGTLLASWIGTTGAAMVLIRPLLRANARRRRRAHLVVFFIFLVGNIGGSLTPLGDPPLFLGFLHGVPFFWTTTHLLPCTAFLSGLLLAVFFVWDSLVVRREGLSLRRAGPGEKREPAGASASPAARQPFRVEGAHNLLFLAGIVGAVLMSGALHLPEVKIAGIAIGAQDLLRDAILIAMGLLSLWTTRRQTRRDNEFSWFPIKEVAYLFAGIFITIIPALAILRAGSHGALAGLLASVREPVHYFWAVGGLSGFLDNAPTYLTFFNSVLGRLYESLPEAQAVAALIRDHAVYLQAVSAGAVFMGANTYIGNAPNFMVRSIAQEAGVDMPSFFGYILRYTLPVLIPAFGLLTLVFFS